MAAWSRPCARATAPARCGRCASTPRAPSTSSPACCRRRCGWPLRPDALASRVEERLGGDLALDPAAEDLDLDRRSGLAAIGRQVGVGDRAFDGVAVAAAGDPAGDPAADADRLVAEGDRARILQGQA